MSADIDINPDKRNFDQEAAKWDQVPGRVKVAQDIARSMIKELTLTPDMDVLDFGCGTGLLTLALQPFVRSITGVDSSRGMIDIFNTKIKEQNLNNIKAGYLDLDNGDVMSGSYHLIVSSMTLHHIREIGPLLKQLQRVMVPDGSLCIADLDLDDGQFHDNNDGVFHEGFHREDLSRMCMSTGFRDVRVVQATKIEKPVGDGRSRLFTIFLLTARK